MAVKRKAAKKAATGKIVKVEGSSITVDFPARSFRQGAPTHAEGRRVVGETHDGSAWITQDDEGKTFHSTK